MQDHSWFDQDYFTNYDSKGNHYSEVALRHTVKTYNLPFIYQMFGLDFPKTALDLGAATGLVLDEIEKEFPDCQTTGVEISDWAITNRTNNNVTKGDVFKFVENCDTVYDLVLVNMLVYLDEQEMASLLQEIQKITHENSVVVPVVLYYEDNQESCLYYQDGKYLVGNDKLPVLARPKRWWLDFLSEHLGDMRVFYEEEPALFFRHGTGTLTPSEIENNNEIKRKVIYDLPSNPFSNLDTPFMVEYYYYTGSIKNSCRFYFYYRRQEDCWNELGGKVSSLEDHAVRAMFLPYLAHDILAGKFGRVRKASLRDTDYYTFVPGLYNIILGDDEDEDPNSIKFMVETDNLM